MKTVKFLNCRIDVSKRVFIPRPETEFWTRLAIKGMKKLSPIRNRISNGVKRKIEVLDIFSATGCVGVSVLKNVKNSFCDFVDIDKNALEQIKINLKINLPRTVPLKAGLVQGKIERGRYRIIKSNVFEKINKKYDFILANPPYVALKRLSEVQPSVLKEEPALALFAGENGMDYIKIFLKGVKNYLGVKPKGKFYLEFDPRQKAEIDIILRKEGYKFQFKKDQFKKWRFLIGRLAK